MQILNKKRLLIGLSIPIVILTICIGTSIGSSNIHMWDIIDIVLNKIFNVPLKQGIDPQDVAIIWIIRLPRVLLAFMVGGILSVGGAVIQSLLKNPIASPYTIGVSAGASLGVGIYIIVGVTIPFLGDFSLPVIGFICGLLTIFAVIAFAKKVDRVMTSNTVILVGMVLSLFTSAILTTLTALFSEDLKMIATWQMGTFALKSWPYVYAGIPFAVIGMAIVLSYTKEMDILSFGEEQALASGVEVAKVKKRLLIGVAILTGSAVALSGVIGFVDLIVPHIARKLFGSKHKVVIPMSFVIGGVFMVLTDLVARTIIAPSELPVGAITALIGAPFFAYIYFGKRRK